MLAFLGWAIWAISSLGLALTIIVLDANRDSWFYELREKLEDHILGHPDYKTITKDGWGLSAILWGIGITALTGSIFAVVITLVLVYTAHTKIYEFISGIRNR